MELSDFPFSQPEAIMSTIGSLNMLDLTLSAAKAEFIHSTEGNDLPIPDEVGEEKKAEKNKPATEVSHPALGRGKAERQKILASGYTKGKISKISKTILSNLDLDIV